MAFMMPVVKNDWDIYKSKRNRRVSECSNPSSCRSRKVSECKSEGPSLSTSPGNEFHAPVPSSCKSVPSNMSKQNYSRTSSRNSEASLQSPIKSSSSSPPKSESDSDSNLNTFHCRLLDKLKKSLKSKDGDSERTSS